MKHGFTLIESVVVIAILAILAFAGMNTITEFQRNAILNSATQELGSTLRVARQNSISGRVGLGETDSYFGVSMNGNSYQLVRYTTTPPSTNTIENHTIDSSLTVTPPSITVTFSRIIGEPNTAATITLSRIGTTTSRTVTVSSNGLISL